MAQGESPFQFITSDNSFGHYLFIMVTDTDGEVRLVWAGQFVNGELRSSKSRGHQTLGDYLVVEAAGGHQWITGLDFTASIYAGVATRPQSNGERSYQRMAQQMGALRRMLEPSVPRS